MRLTDEMEARRSLSPSQYAEAGELPPPPRTPYLVHRLAIALLPQLPCEEDFGSQQLSAHDHATEKH